MMGYIYTILAQRRAIKYIDEIIGKVNDPDLSPGKEWHNSDQPDYTINCQSIGKVLSIKEINARPRYGGTDKLFISIGHEKEVKRFSEKKDGSIDLDAVADYLGEHIRRSRLSREIRQERFDATKAESAQADSIIKEVLGKDYHSFRATGAGDVKIELRIPLDKLREFIETNRQFLG